jgi:hypothetical protein
VGAVQEQAAAERFYQEVGQRLGQVGLGLSADNTRVMPCPRQPAPGHTSVDVLGVELRWGRDRASKPHLKRRTSRKKRRNARKRVTDGCQEKGRSRRKDVFREVSAKWRGSYQDSGVKGHSARWRECFTWAMRLLFNWRKRRSQRRS